MEPWPTVLGRLTQQPAYDIKVGALWWHALAGHTIIRDARPLTGVLAAQLAPGVSAYRLELGGKDAGAWPVLGVNAPSTDHCYPHREDGAVKFAYGGICFAFVYYSKFFFRLFPHL